MKKRLTLLLMLLAAVLSGFSAKALPGHTAAMLDSLIARMDTFRAPASVTAPAAPDSCIIDSLAAMFPSAHIKDLDLDSDENRTIAIGLLNELAASPGIDAASRAAIHRRIASFYGIGPDEAEQRIHHLAAAVGATLDAGRPDALSICGIGMRQALEGDYARAAAILRHASVFSADSVAAERCALMADAADEASKAKKHSRRLVAAALLLVAAALALSIVLALRMHSIRRRSESANMLMKNSDRMKELYIQQFLNLCMVYIERLEHFNVLVARKIKAGQVQDLYDNIESGKYVREQTEKFYEAFDEVVLKIYPHFIDELNSLLRPERAVSLAPGRRLTPELRIAAFARLGIDDSSKVSQFLGLSLNTVYTYRNRLKNRALNRDTFETDLMKIGVFPE